MMSSPRRLSQIQRRVKNCDPATLAEVEKLLDGHAVPTSNEAEGAPPRGQGHAKVHPLPSQVHQLGGAGGDNSNSIDRKIEKAFAFFDRDRSGTVAKSEIRAAMKELGSSAEQILPVLESIPDAHQLDIHEFKAVVKSGLSGLRDVIESTLDHMRNNVKRAKQLGLECQGKESLHTQLTNLFNMQYHYKAVANAQPSVDSWHYSANSKCYHSLIALKSVNARRKQTGRMLPMERMHLILTGGLVDNYGSYATATAAKGRDRRDGCRGTTTFGGGASDRFDVDARLSYRSPRARAAAEGGAWNRVGGSTSGAARLGAGARRKLPMNSNKNAIQEDASSDFEGGPLVAFPPRPQTAPVPPVAGNKRGFEAVGHGLHQHHAAGGHTSPHHGGTTLLEWNDQSPLLTSTERSDDLTRPRGHLQTQKQNQGQHPEQRRSSLTGGQHHSHQLHQQRRSSLIGNQQRRSSLIGNPEVHEKKNEFVSQQLAKLGVAGGPATSADHQGNYNSVALGGGGGGGGRRGSFGAGGSAGAEQPIVTGGAGRRASLVAAEQAAFSSSPRRRSSVIN